MRLFPKTAHRWDAEKGRSMSFGTNLQFLRKKKEMTQEELAEALDVSRQTISKWESDSAFPETEKTLALCELFGCTMDGLLRGDLTKEYTESDKEYDRHMNHFSAAIAGAVGLLIFGLGLLMLLTSLSVSETIATMILMVFIMIAVVIFITAGISHSNFVKDHPTIGRIYDNTAVRRFERFFPILIAAPVGLLLIGVIWLIFADSITPPASLNISDWDNFYTSIFFFFVAVAVPCLVWAGMQKSKYDVDEYHRTTGKITAKRGGEETLAGKISGCIMMTATIVYLIIGIVWNLWHPGWVVFPVGGILCGIVSTIFTDKT